MFFCLTNRCQNITTKTQEAPHESFKKSTGNHFTSKQIANPGQASYTLNACSSIWIHDSTGFLYLRNNLHYNNGSVTTVEFYVDRYGDKIYL